MPFTLTMPKLSPTMTEGSIAKWHKNVGDYVDAGELILDIATDKATIEYQIPDPGWLKKIIVKEGEGAAVGTPLAIFAIEKDESIEGYTPVTQVIEEAPVSTAPQRKEPSAPIERPTAGKRIFASPLARKIAKQEGISLEGIRGTGPRGRIMSRDLKFIPRAAKAPSIDITIPPDAETVPLTTMRSTIAKRLFYSKSTIPHFYLSLKANITKLISLRAELKAAGKRATINDFIIKASANALMEYPNVRSSFITEKELVAHHTHADICVAVSIPGGLITPIVFEAENKSLEEISETTHALANKAREGKLTPEEYSGGAFTISNMGMLGIEEFYAIVNPPQVAILSVGAAVQTPIVADNSIEIATLLPLTLSADHRVVDGVDGAAFLRKIQELLENPSNLLD
jgi:pyruvate dehydrogenase E2 component (dihydrolipoamide acetyltransferase)